MRQPSVKDYLLLTLLALIWASAFFNIKIATYSFGPVTVGMQQSEMTFGAAGVASEQVEAFGIAFNVNDDLSISYGEREVEFGTAGGTHVTEEGDGIAIAYTMGSMKIAGNRNEVKNNDGTSGSSDSMTEIALSFAF